MSLLQKYLKYPPLKYKLDFGDNIRTQHILGSQNLTEFLPDAEGYELLAIDEAQNSRRLPGFCAALGKIRTYSK
ncbi:MAG: hypothetical protein U9Q82_10220 [Chloroflexota bacterium]|nr:hypothetical protein [Chloroflexota bacterium]